jgi:hypothetical protein
MEDDDEQKNLSKIYGSDVAASEIIRVSKKRPRDNDTTTTTTTTTPMTNSVANTSSSNSTATLTSSGIIGSSGRSSSSSMVIFSSQLGRMLSSTERLAPVYVGVRQIRPSSNNNMNRSTTATTATVWKKAIPIHAPPVYKVLTADGQERRMTAQEKKQAKMQHKLLAKQQKHDPIQLVNNHVALHTETNTSCVAQLDSPNAATQTADRYVQLVVDPIRLEEELADVCADDRDGIPPVMLSPPLARLAAIQILAMEQQQKQQQQPLHVVVDDLLAAKWATALQQSMCVAVGIRQKEQLRTMPYHVVPEVWTRLRPKLGPSKANNNDNNINKHDHHTMAAADHTPVTAGTEQDEVRGTPPIAPDDWSWFNLRPRTNDATGGNDGDDDTAAIIQLLHTHTNLHISCGAKFGCHYLLYDGPRHERHAFAGLRILPRNRNTTLAPYPFPIYPTAYDLAGYVRCLNTAGKLALLATVVDDSETSDDDQSSPTGSTPRPRRVLIIDLALEKIAATTSRRPKKSMEQRLKNLAKSSS